MPDRSTQDRLLAELYQHFEALEQAAAHAVSAQPGEHLVIRLDGFKASRHYLKDALENSRFDKALSDAVRSVYYAFRFHTRRLYRNVFVCILTITDEVSFVLNDAPNYYDGRTLKLSTLLSGYLSAAMTLHYRGKRPPPAATGSPAVPGSGGEGRLGSGYGKLPEIIAFDARPLLLRSHDEIERYLQHRFLLGLRNAMCKVLRIQSGLPREDIYETELKDRLTLLDETIRSRRLSASLAQVLSTFRLFIPRRDGELQELAGFDDWSGPGVHFPTLRSFHAFLRSAATSGPDPGPPDGED